MAVGGYDDRAAKRSGSRESGGVHNAGKEPGVSGVVGVLSVTSPPLGQRLPAGTKVDVSRKAPISNATGSAALKTANQPMRPSLGERVEEVRARSFATGEVDIDRSGWSDNVRARAGVEKVAWRGWPGGKAPVVVRARHKQADKSGDEAKSGRQAVWRPTKAGGKDRPPRWLAQVSQPGRKPSHQAGAGGLVTN